MATRRLVMSAALRRSFRATNASAAIAPGAPCLLRAALSTASQGPRAKTTTTTASRTAIIRRITPGTATSVRWSSDSAAASKIWTFEEINKAIASPTSTPKVTIIDTREPSELSQTGRIPGALNIPIASAPDSFHIGADEFQDRFGFERPEVPADDDDVSEIVFYCKAGVRSRAAAQIAREAGYKNVGEYPGSWLDWVEKGGKVER
ncbi:Rhodanese-like protein [Hypoxylon crocopeplum]|nr:Rhodanese-like protein [Hypoxylon crocopeplum]